MKFLTSTQAHLVMRLMKIKEPAYLPIVLITVCASLLLCFERWSIINAIAVLYCLLIVSLFLIIRMVNDYRFVYFVENDKQQVGLSLFDEGSKRFQLKYKLNDIEKERFSWLIDRHRVHHVYDVSEIT